MDFVQRRMCLAFLVIYLSGSALADIITEPKHTTIQQGEDVLLECITNSASDSIEWRSDRYMDGTVPIFSSDTEIVDTDKYERGGTGANYNLIIKNTVWNDGGKYTCTHFGKLAADAQVVVLGTPTAVIFSLIEGRLTELQCKMEYGGSLENELIDLIDNEYDQVPHLEAKMDDNKIDHNSYERNERGPSAESSLLKLTYNYTAQAGDHGKLWTCRGYTSDPSYEVIYEEELEIQYGVRNLVIAPYNSVFYAGEVINCTADGHPEPDITWTAIQSPGAQPVSGSQLTITANMEGYNEWKCEAINSAVGSSDPISDTIIFTVEEGSPPGGDSGESGDGGGSDTVAIAAGVTVSIIVIIVIALVIFFLWRRKNKKAGETSEKTTYPANSGYDQGGEPGVNPAVDTRPDPTAQTQAVPAGYHAYTGPGAPPNVGRDSPGYGDLGIKHMNANGNPNISFDDSFVDEKPKGPAYSNEVYNPSPKGSAQDLSVAGDGGTAV